MALAPSGASESPNDPPAVDPRNNLNDLTASQWVSETTSVWVQRGLGSGHPEAAIERQHPAPFSFTDVARLIRLFTKPGATVLDPFVGVGSTLKACALEGRHGIGIELNPKYVDLTRLRLSHEVPMDAPGRTMQDILCGDARDLLPTLPADSVDFLVTSPPYWQILRKADHKVRQERHAHDLDANYGDDSRDLGNIADYPTFLAELTNLFALCTVPLKVKKYLAVIVSDFRHKSDFIMFHADLARALEPYSLELRGIKVLYQKNKRVFPYGYPYAYVPNIHHQYILILQNMQGIR